MPATTRSNGRLARRSASAAERRRRAPVRNAVLRVATALALAVLTGMLVSAPATGARIVGRSAEISIGRETASLVERYLPVDRDPVAAARVRAIGRRLAAGVRGVDYPFEFHVIEEAEINAFALPGGFIYIYRGLLQLLPTDDALASVLAHEISHVTRRHAARQFEKNLVVTAALTAILRGTGAGGGAEEAAGVVQAIAGIGFTRADEADADAHGIQLLAAAGYDPLAAAEAMRVLKRAVGDQKEPAFLRTHPAPDNRIKRLAALGEQLRARVPSTPRAILPPPPLPATALPLEGLAHRKLAPCPWQPLAAGARWTYLVTSGDDADGTRTRLAVRVLEALSGPPEGVFRVELEYERGGVRTRRLLAPAGSLLYSRPDTPAGTWRVEATFPGDSCGGGDLDPRALERVQVPAGEFQALRVAGAGGEAGGETVSWYVKGVGLVRRAGAGTLQELLSWSLPVTPRAPVQDGMGSGAGAATR